MGTVPAVLNSNPFAVGFDEENGALAVASVEEMPAPVMALLRDEARLSQLAERGMRTARTQVDWDAYIARVDDALRRPPCEDPAREARAAVGTRLMAREATTQTQLESERDTALEQLRAETQATIARIEAERGQLIHERDTYTEQLHATQANIQAITNTRTWRLARTFWRTRALTHRLIAR